MPPPDQVTGLLRAWTDGDEGALAALMPIVYSELRRLARLYMSRERHGLTLQPTALVNEAYLRLVDIRRVRWQDRHISSPFRPASCAGFWSIWRGHVRR